MCPNLRQKYRKCTASWLQNSQAPPAPSQAFAQALAPSHVPLHQLEQEAVPERNVTSPTQHSSRGDKVMNGSAAPGALLPPSPSSSWTVFCVVRVLKTIPIPKTDFLNRAVEIRHFLYTRSWNILSDPKYYVLCLMTFSSILIIKLGKFQNKICFENKKKNLQHFLWKRAKRKLFISLHVCNVYLTCIHLNISYNLFLCVCIVRLPSSKSYSLN